jgi:hypothetical protein
MSRILLVSNAHHDVQTQYLTSWFEKVVEVAKRQADIEIVEIKKTEASKKNLVATIEREKPQLVVFNGHGTEETVCGFEGQVLVGCNDNESLLSGKIVHSMACRCASMLGPRCVALGTRCFIGYKEDFELWSARRESREEQQKDQMAGLFLDPAFEVLIALVEGATTGEAYARSQKKYKENILALIASSNKQHSTEIAASLYSNLKNQVCLGDQAASF